jgi:outer membrane protein assembly factor BamB
MSRRTALAWVLVLLGSLPAHAQAPFARDLVPTRTSLGRLGLERHWMAVIPLVNEERVLSINLADDLLFAQTSQANFHVFQAESGQHLWSTKLGIHSAHARPASVNSFAVFVTNLNRLFALDRRTGRTMWVHELGVLPSSATACDEDRLTVGLGNGKIYGFDLKIRSEGKAKISDHPIELWNWLTGGVIETRPVLAQKLVAFGSDDGKVYVALSEERTMLYRIATDGAIGDGMGTFGTRLLLVPSADRNLYAVDILTSDVRWTFPSGAPIKQEPLVADNDIFVINTAGQLSSLDPNTGSPRWTVATQGGRLLSLGAKRIYLESSHKDLFIIDRVTGHTIADPRATSQRAGLNLRPFDHAFTNSLNDRLYFATASGMVICLRESGQVKPRPVRDPKALPFGYIPREGVKLTPPAPPPAALESSPPPGEEKAAPEPPADDEKPPKAEPEGDTPK